MERAFGSDPWEAGDRIAITFLSIAKVEIFLEVGTISPFARKESGFDISPILT